MGNGHRPDFNHVQVAAATGTPILAQTPITTHQPLTAVQIPQPMLAQNPQPYQVF